MVFYLLLIVTLPISLSPNIQLSEHVDEQLIPILSIPESQFSFSYACVSGTNVDVVVPYVSFLYNFQVFPASSENRFVIADGAVNVTALNVTCM